jgi:hypothetical protein
MSFNRLTYDQCAYSQQQAENIGTLSYLMDPIKYENANPCRVELGLVGGNNVGVPNGNMVDLEKDLLGINRPSTQCAQYKYVPSGDGVVQGREYIKPVQHPAVDASMRQLRTCTKFAAVPSPPQGPPPAFPSCGEAGRW